MCIHGCKLYPTLTRLFLQYTRLLLLYLFEVTSEGR